CTSPRSCVISCAATWDSGTVVNFSCVLMAVLSRAAMRSTAITVAKSHPPTVFQGCATQRRRVPAIETCVQTCINSVLQGVWRWPVRCNICTGTKETSANNAHPTTTVGIVIFPCLPLAPQQIRQGTWSEAYRQYPCTPQRHEEEETYHTACPAVEAGRSWCGCSVNQ